MRQQNFAKQNWTEKDSNKEINTNTDNKAEDHKRRKLITSQESSLCVCVCVCVVCLRKNKIEMYIYNG